MSMKCQFGEGWVQLQWQWWGSLTSLTFLPVNPHLSLSSEIFFFCFWVWGDALGQPRVVPPTLRALTMFGSSWIRRSPRFARSSCSASRWIQLLTGKRARAERNAVQNSSGRHSTGEQMQEERGPRAHTRRIKAREIWGPFTQLEPCRALFFWMRTSKAFSQQTPS